LARSIKITRLEMEPEVNLQMVGALRLRIVASEAVGMDGEIFVWHQLPKSPHQEEAYNIGSHTASAADMEELPIGEPSPGSPFFRRNYLDMLFRSTTALEAAWERTIDAVDNLLQGLDALDTLSETSTICVGDCSNSTSL
jgi:hypothetical protein